MNLCSLSFWLNSLSYESKKIAQKKKDLWWCNAQNTPTPIFILTAV